MKKDSDNAKVSVKERIAESKNRFIDNLKFSKKSFAKKIKNTFTKDNVRHYFKERRGTLIVFGVLLLFVVWGIISIQIAKHNATPVDYKNYEPREATHDPKEVLDSQPDYKLIASDDKLEIYFDYAKVIFKVIDKTTGYVWKSAVDEEVYPNFRRSNDLWKQKMSSSVIITYNDLKAREGMSTEINHAGFCDYLEVEDIDNGVSVLYGFTKQGIFFNVEYTLENGEFVVRIPADKIVEETRYIINSITVLPFFGAASTTEEGYMVYPDGCGALTLFDNASNRVQSVKKGTWYVYSTNKVTLDYWMGSDNYERYTAALPLYGIKHGNNAFYAVVSNGDEVSGITCEPAGCNNVELSRIYFDLRIRNLFEVSQFNVSTDVGVKSGGRDITRVDKQVILGKREIRYHFLNNDEANYSGIAKSYRNYLLETGQLADTIEDGEKYPLALSFMMGVTERQLVFDKYVVMTSIDNLMEMLDDLQSAGVEAGKINLTHWIKKDRDYPSYWPIASQIGGKNGLKSLDNYLSEHKGFSVFLDNNLIFADEDEKGFSAVSDVVYGGVSKPVDGKYTDGYYLLTPEKVLENAEKFIDKISRYNNIGIGYEWLGMALYEDYNEDYVYTVKDANGNEVSSIYTRLDTMNTWKKILAATQNAGKEVAVSGANRYTYGNVDYLYDIPIKSYGLSITDYSIPLVQMVISGLIPYSSEIYETGNLTYDLEVQKLEWIEFGALPNFYLTYENALKLKDTGYSFLFTSTYSFWRERVIDTYNEFKENFGDTYGEQMISHEILGKDIRRIEYSNGKIIYLNYSSEEVIIDNVKIPAVGYTVIGKGAK